MFFQKSQNHNYTQQKEPLSPNLAVRGAYLNSGSRDIGKEVRADFSKATPSITARAVAGADPSWQMINGRRVNINRDILSTVSEEELAEFRRRHMQAAKGGPQHP